MSLLEVQRELAALLMEEPARRAFAANPKGYAKAAGLKGNDAKLIAGLDPDDLQYFASRRQIDRRVMLAADLPRASELLGRPLAYFRAYPYAYEDPIREAKRFARWAQKNGPPLLGDVALYEATVLALASRPWRAGKPALALLRLDHTAHQAEPKAEPACYVLVRRPDEVMWYRVDEVDLQLLDKAGKLPEAEWLKAAAKEAGVSVAEARKAAKGLRAEGLLS